MRIRPETLIAALAILAASWLAGCKTAEPVKPPPPPPVFPDEWRVVDLTRVLDRDAPHLPHEDAFPFERIALEGEAAGRRVGVWSALGLMGTHVETPAVFGGDGATVERLPVQHLVLPAVVIDAPPSLAPLDGPGAGTTAVDIAAVLAYEALHGRIPAGSLVVLRTGDGDLGSKDLALAGRTPPGGHAHRGWSADAVRFLANERGARALGTDALTVDPGAALPESPAARAAAESGLVTVQSLANLGTLPRRGAVVVLGVVPVRGALASQARVVAFVPPPRPQPPRAETDASGDDEPGTDTR